MPAHVVACRRRVRPRGHWRPAGLVFPSCTYPWWAYAYPNWAFEPRQLRLPSLNRSSRPGSARLGVEPTGREAIVLQVFEGSLEEGCFGRRGVHGIALSTSRGQRRSDGHEVRHRRRTPDPPEAGCTVGRVPSTRCFNAQLSQACRGIRCRMAWNAQHHPCGSEQRSRQPPPPSPQPHHHRSPQCLAPRQRTVPHYTRHDSIAPSSTVMPAGGGWRAMVRRRMPIWWVSYSATGPDRLRPMSFATT